MSFLVMQAGPGTVQSAPGIKVPPGGFWRLLHMSLEMSTDATAVNRYPFISAARSGDPVVKFIALSATAIAASLTRTITFGRNTVAITPGAGLGLIIPIVEYVIEGDNFINFNASNSPVGDTVTASVWTLERLI